MESLEDIVLILGDRNICVAREMTKMFEEYWRGDVRGAVDHFKSQPARGEFTLVIEGKTAEKHERWTEAQLLEAIERQASAEKSAKELSAELAKSSGWNRRDVYFMIVSKK